MTKENYREKVEEHRQEIDLHNESGAKMSRISRHRKKSAKKQSNPMMTLLTIVLIFIPLTILGYVWFIYEPSTSANEKVDLGENNDVVLEIVKQGSEAPKAAADEEDERDEADGETSAAETDDAAAQKAEKERLAAEEARKAEEKVAQEKAAREAAEAKKAEESQKAAAEKAKELEEKKKAEAAAKAQQKTHTVQSTDNLYRIALKYYGDGSPANIEKIKSANNLTSDNISAGQVLVILP